MRWNKKIKFILDRLEQEDRIFQADLQEEITEKFNLSSGGKQWINYLKDIGIIKFERHRVPDQLQKKVLLIYDGEKVAQEKEKLSARF